MLIVHVHVHVKKDKIEDFKKISIENAKNSIKEPGVERFDVIQQNDDESHLQIIQHGSAPDHRVSGWLAYRLVPGCGVSLGD